jgi:hypothetical protein
MEWDELGMVFDGTGGMNTRRDGRVLRNGSADSLTAENSIGKQVWYLALALELALVLALWIWLQ